MNNDDYQHGNEGFKKDGRRTQGHQITAAVFAVTFLAVLIARSI